jgi:hypothetical protein
MAIGRYSPELIEEAANAIAVAGTDSAGWRAIGISRPTFYDWLKKYPEFADAINKARQEYRKVKHHSLKRAANKALLDYLTGNMVKVSHIRKEVVTPTGEIVELEEHHTTPVGIPQWAIVRVLGQPMSEVEAIMALADQEILPEWIVDYAKQVLAEAREKIAEAIRGSLPENEIQQFIEARTADKEDKGVSDEVFSAIRARIMGIDAPSSTPLPNPVSNKPRKGKNKSEV